MRFTAWHIDRLRRGLASYRVFKAAGGRRRPWKAVLDDLILSEETSLSYGKDGQPSALREEALRRFATGASVLDPGNLEDLRRFLVATGMVRKEEFEDGGERKDDAEFFAVRDFMANEDAEARSRLGRFASTYEARSTPAHQVEWITLEIVPDSAGSFVRVEERYRRLLPEEEQLFGRGTQPLMRQAVRRGYGFLSTTDNLLHIFVRGAAKADRIHYVEIAGLSDFVRPMLHRVGAQPGGYVEAEGAARMQHMLGVYDFVAEDVPQPSPEHSP